MNKQNKLYKFATAVSFTVEETIRKMACNPHRRFNLVMQDAYHNFNYSFEKIAEENSYSLDTDYCHTRVQKEILILNNFWPAALFLNIGPGKIVSPEIIEIGDIYLCLDESTIFEADSECVLFYRNLKKYDRHHK